MQILSGGKLILQKSPDDCIRVVIDVAVGLAVIIFNNIFCNNCGRRISYVNTDDSVYESSEEQILQNRS